jgi:hypothetical protein
VGGEKEAKECLPMAAARRRVAAAVAGRRRAGLGFSDGAAAGAGVAEKGNRKISLNR